MNPFQLLPAKVRAAFYLAYSGTALATTSIAAGYGAIQHAVPVWVLWTAGALVPIGSLLGVTAVSNTPAKAAALVRPFHDPDATDQPAA